MEQLDFKSKFTAYWDYVSFTYETADLCGCKKYSLFDSDLKAAPEIIEISYTECPEEVGLSVDTSAFADATFFNLIMRVELIDYPTVPPTDQAFKLKILPPSNVFTPPEPKPEKKE